MDISSANYLYAIILFYSSHAIELQSQSVTDELVALPVYETIPDLEIRKASKHNQPVQVEPNIAYGTCVPALGPNIAYVFRFQRQTSKLFMTIVFLSLC